MRLLIPSFRGEAQGRRRGRRQSGGGRANSTQRGRGRAYDERGVPTSVGVLEERGRDELFELKSQCTEGTVDSVTLTDGCTERTTVSYADESEHVHGCAAADKHPGASVFTATHPAGESARLHNRGRPQGVDFGSAEASRVSGAAGRWEYARARAKACRQHQNDEDRRCY
jgi:hypothetical protein